MIPEAAVKRLARQQGVDPVVVDRDHALGVVLWALAPELPSSGWVFKGGTCLRKCYYGDYRFSEDLDFTVVESLQTDAARGVIARAAMRADAAGVHLDLDRARVAVMDDEYGRESLEIKVPYRGALRMGSAPNVQFHLSADEEMAFGARQRGLVHPYDDASDIIAEIPCYALEEILTEKLRAVSGQRRHAIARDVYDVGQLLSRLDVDQAAALAALPRKAEYKGLELSGAHERFVRREAEYRANWEQALAYLVRGEPDFEVAFTATAEILGRRAPAGRRASRS